MKAKTINKKGAGKTALIALTAITACTFLFSGLTEGVMATEIQKTDMVSTSYSAPIAGNTSVPKGYVKANYMVKTDTSSGQPTTKDLTQDTAAELGAQMLWELHELNLNDAVFYMNYNPGTETFPRAFWSGDVRFGSKTTDDRKPQDTAYGFMIDAVTGERFSTSTARTLSEDVSLAFDSSLMKNSTEYEVLAKQLAEKYNLVKGEVKSTEYGGQGYANNDPSISIQVNGISGEKAQLTFSKYDKKLVGVSYHTSIKISDDAMEKFLERVNEQAEAAKKNALDQGKGGTMTPNIVPIELDK